MLYPVLDEITQTIQRFGQTPEIYRHRLIMLIMPLRNESRYSLEEFAIQHGFRYINISLELSRRLLDIPRSKHSVQTPQVLNREIVGSEHDQPLFLDNLAVLHEPSLKLDPVRWLLEVARRRTVIATWAGGYASEHLNYAEPGHPEYNQYSTKDIVVIRVESDA
jgi:hypothetical protein